MKQTNLKETVKNLLEYNFFKTEKEALKYLEEAHKSTINFLKKDIETAEIDFELLRNGNKVYMLETSSNHLNLLDNYIRKQKQLLIETIHQYY
jgi:hypothetical protein